MREWVGLEEVATDLFERRIGPHHPWMTGPIVFKVLCDGDRVSSLVPEFGYGHKGLERRMEATEWSSLMPLADRLDSEVSLCGEWVVATAFEQIAKVRVPDRAQWARLLLLELSRVVSHLRFAVRIARAVGAETPAQYFLRDAEKFLDLIEHLTGARYNCNYICPGGVREDVTEGFVERTLEACNALLARMPEYRRVLLENGSFLKRAANAGVLDPRWIEIAGVTGPNLRASGVPHDLRKQKSGVLASLYGPVEFEVPIGSGHVGRLGDVADRVDVRFREIIESVRIVQQAAPRIPKGEFRVSPSIREVPPGEAYVEVESPRGVLGCFLVSRGGAKPFRLHFRPASLGSVRAFMMAARGAALDDFRMILSSFDLSPAEVDR